MSELASFAKYPILLNALRAQRAHLAYRYLGACSQIPNLLLNLLNLFVVVKGAGLTCRIFTSLYVIFAICVLTIGLIFVSSTQWPLGFFLLTMFSVILLNSANGVYQNSIYGLIADFPPHFTNAVILGNNLCGIFVSFLAILTLLCKRVQWTSLMLTDHC